MSYTVFRLAHVERNMEDAHGATAKLVNCSSEDPQSGLPKRQNHPKQLPEKPVPPR